MRLKDDAHNLTDLKIEKAYTLLFSLIFEHKYFEQYKISVCVIHTLV